MPNCQFDLVKNYISEIAGGKHIDADLDRSLRPPFHVQAEVIPSGYESSTAPSVFHFFFTPFSAVTKDVSTPGAASGFSINRLLSYFDFNPSTGTYEVTLYLCCLHIASVNIGPVRGKRIKNNEFKILHLIFATILAIWCRYLYSNKSKVFSNCNLLHSKRDAY